MNSLMVPNSKVKLFFQNNSFLINYFMKQNVMAANMDQTVLLHAAIVFGEVNAILKMVRVRGNATVATKGLVVLKASGFFVLNHFIY